MRDLGICSTFNGSPAYSLGTPDSAGVFRSPAHARRAAGSCNALVIVPLACRRCGTGTGYDSPWSLTLAALYQFQCLPLAAGPLVRSGRNEP